MTAPAATMPISLKILNPFLNINTSPTTTIIENIAQICQDFTISQTQF